MKIITTQSWINLCGGAHPPWLISVSCLSSDSITRNWCFLHNKTLHLSPQRCLTTWLAATADDVKWKRHTWRVSGLSDYLWHCVPWKQHNHLHQLIYTFLERHTTIASPRSPILSSFHRQREQKTDLLLSRCHLHWARRHCFQRTVHAMICIWLKERPKWKSRPVHVLLTSSGHPGKDGEGGRGEKKKLGNTFLQKSLLEAINHHQSKGEP